MTEPLRPAANAPAPATTIELEPVVISARPSTTTVRPPIPVGDIALGCAAKLDAVALAFLAKPISPAVGVLVGLKAGIDLGECIAEKLHDAAVREAQKQCADAGGTVKSFVDNTLTCELPAEVAE